MHTDQHLPKVTSLIAVCVVLLTSAAQCLLSMSEDNPAAAHIARSTPDVVSHMGALLTRGPTLVVRACIAGEGRHCVCVCVCVCVGVCVCVCVCVCWCISCSLTSIFS